MVKISLIRPLKKTTAYDPEVQEPLGIETLAGFLEAQGHIVQVLDPEFTGQAERYICRQVAAFHPAIIGFSLMQAGELDSAIRMIHQIKAVEPSIVIVAGGNLISTEPFFAINALPVGVVCIRYEGELPFLKIVDAVENSTPISNTGSVIIKQVDDRVTETPILMPIPDIDEIPFASRPFMDLLIQRDLAINIQGSRGCVGTCRYCCVPGFPKSIYGRRRDKSPVRIVDEVQSIVESSSATIFNFVDDDFLGPNKTAAERARVFSTEIIKRGLKISFGIQARPSTLDLETIKLLASAGLSYVFFGLETDEETAMLSWGRKQLDYDLSGLVKNLRSFNIEVQAGCIPFHPGSSIKNIKRLANLLQNQGLLNYRTATNRLQALPGSEIYRELEQKEYNNQVISGPYLPNFSDYMVDSFYNNLIKILEPVRSIWIFAASKLPVVKAKSLLNGQKFTEELRNLQSAISILNEWVAKSLFQLLCFYEMDKVEDIEVEEMINKSLIIAMEVNHFLFKSGFVESEERLCEIIRIDLGR